MSNLLPMHPPLSTLDEDAWEDLLNFIEEKRVIPIVGPELTVVQTDAGPENLYTWLARALAARLGMSATTENGTLEGTESGLPQARWRHRRYADGIDRLCP